jgi:dihydrofolate synthase / folylpolyglutamate synthase
LDGAHNPAAAKVLAEELAGWPVKPVLVAGMLGNKDYRAMLALLAPVVERLLAVPVPRSTAGLPPEVLVAAGAEAGIASEVLPDLEAALARAGAVGPGRHVLVAGSLYLAGAALRLERGG